MAAPATEWSQLPRELLDLISKHLPSETDLLRFRSVCSSWRSSVSSPKPYPSFPSRFLILPNQGISDTCWGFHLSKRIIYCLRLPIPRDSNHIKNNAWIIKVERDNPARMHLLSPLSNSLINPLPPDFPRNFDFSKYQISELAHEYTLQHITYRPSANSVGDAGNLYMEKVALSVDKDGRFFVLLTIHISGKLVLLMSSDRNWTAIDYFPAPYDDVIFQDGRFYAVDNIGGAVVVNIDPGSSPSVSTAAEPLQGGESEPLQGGEKKYLVESCGELLMVDKYLSLGPEDDLGYIEDFQFYEDFDCYMSERTIRFKVFKLDKQERRWVELGSLGDRMVFLGENCTFSALASEINSNCKSNCILFADQFYCGKEEEGGVWKSRGIGVFDLETGSIGPICDYAGYSDLFWPAPDWVHTTAAIEEGLDQLNI